MNPDRWTDRPWKIAAWTFGHAAFFFLAVQLVHWWMYGSVLPIEAVLRFDAEHYIAIAHEGYVPFRQAFFPLMPQLWRVTGASIGGMCMINGMLYLLSLSWLGWILRANLRTLLLFLTAPTSFFFFVPYTEAVFFAFSVLVLIGLRRRTMWMILLGLLLCSMTRPTFTTLLPSVILGVCMSFPNRGLRIWLSIACLITCLAGLSVVSAIQHGDTGDWFGFYRAQAAWGNRFALPSIPFTSWGGNDVVRLDAIAMLIGLCSGAWLMYRRTSRPSKGPSIDDGILYLSLASLASVTLLVLCLRGGQLFSLNRFILCTPFLLVVLSECSKCTRPMTGRFLFWFFLGLQGYFVLFGSMVHIQNLLLFTLVLIYVLLVAISALGKPEMKEWAFPVTLLCALALQVGLTVKFLTGGWVG